TKICSNYISTDLQALLKEEKETVDLEKKITPENFAELICLVSEGEISSNIAKIVLSEMFKTQKDPSDIISEKGLAQITDSSEIEGIIKEVLVKNPKAVEDFKAGKENSFAFLIGQTMAASKGKANPQMIAELLKKAL
ncbi:MAG: Asp-tRNA(Asn)/Glu-tRNA(Gln) amidotransferase subunit GatB, partial [Candidatus Pacearchaeota archaeon]